MREMLGSANVRLPRQASALITSILALATLIHLTRPIVGLYLPIPHSYNEGWNAFHTLAVLNSKTLYPDPSALITNNYPPLSFYIIAPLGDLLGDNIFAGRIVALISFLFVGASIIPITLRCGVPPSVALFSGLLFTTSASVQFANYMVIDDPEWLGHAFAMLGLLLLLQKKVRAASVFVFLGGMVKHSLVPLPLSITLWLLLFYRRDFYIWIMTSVALFVASMTLFYLLYGVEFFSHIFNTARTYSVENISFFHKAQKL